MNRIATRLLAAVSLAAPWTSAAGGVDFNRDIRPILSDNCFQCHGPDAAQRKAELRLDTHEGALADLGGHAAVVPHDPARSELIARVVHGDPKEVMPPPKSKRKLTPRQIELLRLWVEEGAPWSEHWSFIPPQRPALPEIGLQESKIANPIDRFVFARLAQEKLAPSPPATKEQIVRRVTLDLTGLPPTPAEIDAFLADPSPDAYEKVVDRLLASPRYGERWCWDWLDAARYADTNGYQGDPERTMWPWRDWVTTAINANMPYDRFTVEQLAGDLLPGAAREQILASGFNRNHMHNGEGGRIAEETRVENVFDRVETLGTLWMGITLNCCRCHDHKFDPVTQREYYQFFDYFNQTSENGGGRGGKIAPVIDMTTPDELAQVREAEEKVKVAAAEVEKFELEKFPRPEGAPLSETEAVNLPGNLPRYIGATEPAKRGVDQLLEAVGYFKERDPAYTKVLQDQLAAVRKRDAATAAITKVMVMDHLAEPRESFILEKGLYSKPLEKVTAGVPARLPALPPDAPPTRLALAQWIVSPEHPLTARVTVNRFWQAFFGTGLVKTVEDFGVQGEKPSHPGLLDWLAVEFMETGWDVKALHRLIVTSATYRQSSKVTPALHERDPENRLLARGPRYRLPSWMIRDQALAASGLLVNRIGGPSVNPYQPPGIWEEATFGKKSYRQDEGEKLYRRTLYTFWRRIVGPTMLFDNAARQTCTVKNFHTNTPLHALTTLNDITYVEASRVMAERVLKAAPSDDARIRTAFRLATSRGPSLEEAAILQGRLGALRDAYRTRPEEARALLAAGEWKADAALDPAEIAAWAGICSLILNLDETITKQ